MKQKRSYVRRGPRPLVVDVPAGAELTPDGFVVVKGRRGTRRNEHALIVLSEEDERRFPEALRS